MMLKEKSSRKTKKFRRGQSRVQLLLKRQILSLSRVGDGSKSLCQGAGGALAGDNASAAKFCSRVFFG
jgi:hypothetical protein